MAEKDDKRIADAVQAALKLYARNNPGSNLPRGAKEQITKVIEQLSIEILDTDLLASSALNRSRRFISKR